MLVVVVINIISSSHRFNQVVVDLINSHSFNQVVIHLISSHRSKSTVNNDFQLSVVDINKCNSIHMTMIFIFDKQSADLSSPQHYLYNTFMKQVFTRLLSSIDYILLYR